MAFSKLKRVSMWGYGHRKLTKVVRFLLSHFTPALCLNSTPTLTPKHQSSLTHSLKFSKSHYAVIQVGQFCTHAGTKKRHKYTTCLLIQLCPLCLNQCWMSLMQWKIQRRGWMRGSLQKTLSKNWIQLIYEDSEEEDEEVDETYSFATRRATAGASAPSTRKGKGKGKHTPFKLPATPVIS